MKSKTSKTKKTYRYDCVVVLCGGIKEVKVKNRKIYIPTSIEDSTEMGLAGGIMRILASVELYINKKAKLFMFSSGKSPKMIRLYGVNIPSESKVYTAKFLELIKNHQSEIKNLDKVENIIEDKSCNTQDNIKEVLHFIRKEKWKKVAILTSEYHVPRTKLFYKYALQQHPEIKTKITFLSAEKILKKYQPGKYNKIIKKAYKSPAGVLRLKNEAQGIKDFKSGKYKIYKI